MEIYLKVGSLFLAMDFHIKNKLPTLRPNTYLHIQTSNPECLHAPTTNEQIPTRHCRQSSMTGKLSALKRQTLDTEHERQEVHTFIYGIGSGSGGGVGGGVAAASAPRPPPPTQNKHSSIIKRGRGPSHL